MPPPSSLLAAIPAGLRDPLVQEYNSIVQNFMEHRWSPSELSGGKFCEIVYTILDGYFAGSYLPSPTKPKDFVAACRALESKAGGPRSFQILIPRMLPALYEIRNNRGVGHAGGDVDPNSMDAAAVLSMASWVMAELVRVFHGTSTSEAQEAVEGLVERRIPAVWSNGDVRRVLRTGLKLKDQIILLVGAATTPTANQVYEWTEYKNRAHFNSVLRGLHSSRFVEYDQSTGRVILLPPGSTYLAELLRKIA
jgi:hypothetical protein